MLNRTTILSLFLFVMSLSAYAQPVWRPAPGDRVRDTTANSNMLTLNDCIRYALKNQPALKQSLIDEAIARTNNAIAFSAWLPQVTGAANIQHYFQLPTVYTRINGTLTSIPSGVYDYSTPSVAANQLIFSPDVLLATRAARLNILGSRQNTTSTKINLVTDVSKTFYDLLLSLEQINVYKEDTARLRKNQADAYNRFVSGVVDKVDYKQATIALNNSMAQLKKATEAVQAKYALLQQYMGFEPEQRFTVKFDTVQMQQDIYVDTLATLQFEKRIEWQQLQTARRIMHETTQYYQLGFLPSLSASYNYNYQFQANDFSDLYSRAYPYSLVGLQLNIPIFTGFRRNENVHKYKLEEERIDWDQVNLKLGIYAEYKQALADYKGNLYYLHAQNENVQMAREVYNIVKLQYREGIKAYLDVIVAESDLQQSEINYLNALFQLLQSKIDLERAMGNIPTDI